MTALRKDAIDLLGRMPEDKLIFLVEIMKGVEKEKTGTVSPQKREMLEEMQRLFRPNRNLDIPAIREAVYPIARQHGVERMYLFGSRARGDYRPDSDYDFLIAPGTVNSLSRMAAFVDDLETAFQSHVDVITENTNDEKLVAEAERDAVLLYECTG